MTDIEEHAIQAGARAILDHWRYIEKFSRSDAPLPDGPAWDLARAAIDAYEAALGLDAANAYRAGQEAMRERAADTIFNESVKHYAEGKSISEPYLSAAQLSRADGLG